MRKFPRPLRQLFRPIKPRSSLIEQALVLTSILAAIILAVMALVVHRINHDAATVANRSIRALETARTLDQLALALRDGEMASRDLAGARGREPAERLEAARFQVRLHLGALGPLTGDDPAQSERLSRLEPLVNRRSGFGTRGYDAPTSAGARDEIDNLIATMRDDEHRRLESDRAIQLDAHEQSTWITVASLALVSVLTLVFWMLLKIEFRARRALEKRLIESATTDELTGVTSRTEFDHKLVQEWAFRTRYSTALSLLVVDVDEFRKHNEQWGPVAGDAILREVARRLASRLRRTELLARSEADAFAIIVPQYRKEALALAEQLRAQIAAAPFHIPGRDQPLSIAVTVSIGVAEASDVDTPRQLLAAADEATFAAKSAGRNAVEAYRPNLTTGVMRPTTRVREKGQKSVVSVL